MDCKCRWKFNDMVDEKRYFLLIKKNKGVSQDLKKNPCAVFGMDFNSEGNKFVVVGKDMHVRIYDTDSK